MANITDISPNSTVLHLDIYLLYLCNYTDLNDTAGQSARLRANLSVVDFLFQRVIRDQTIDVSRLGLTVPEKAESFYSYLKVADQHFFS